MPTGDGDRMTMTLEAFADTIIPGEKRGSDDHAIAGATTGPGAVASGAIEVLEMRAPGLAAGLAGFADRLNEHATAYSRKHGLRFGGALPPFVALPFSHRTNLVFELTAPDHAEKDGWVLLALFSNMAFDTAPHLHTVEALESGHPGLTTLGFAPPDSDGLWRFPRFSYGRRLARRHPDTTPSGSPA
ncbi:DUF5987 family protein [Amycolatopsis sp. QT-25]|uniref:DUF5987 family protein n=1 Tax=Amycolatopsis sp. QT-25 TaxID=3034022 RepID=UPI0023ECB629|nr:DUF5987 family protein [Amycolatopsis sp. QT-25]WET76186.1 DUF5987 family protein [Amycolatopsis sp. QT-25]